MNCLGRAGRNVEESGATLALLLLCGLTEGACLGMRIYSLHLPLGDGALYEL